MLHAVRASLLAITLLAACSGDGPTGPRSGAGLYRLVSVDEHPLPYLVASLGGFVVVATHGDLLLRADGTFALGLADGRFSLLTPGRWRRAGAALRLTVLASRDGEADTELLAGMAGDSIMLHTNHRFVFRRAALPQPPVTSGTYVLTSLNGRTDLTIEDSSGGWQDVARVLFDSITISEGLFFRRHRAEHRSSIGPSGEMFEGRGEWESSGSYHGSDDTLVLREYAAWQNGRSDMDSVTVTPGSLIRRRVWNSPTGEQLISEDVYSRRP